MKKAYNKAEAYKISFNATEQVAAACGVDVSSKFIAETQGMTMCSVEGDKYGVEGWGSCLVNDDGTSSMFADWWAEEGIQYAS